jgi:hypothetical protein
MRDSLKLPDFLMQPLNFRDEFLSLAYFILGPVERDDFRIVTHERTQPSAFALCHDSNVIVRLPSEREKTLSRFSSSYFPVNFRLPNFLCVHIDDSR